MYGVCKKCGGRVAQLYADFCNVCATGTLVDMLLANHPGVDIETFIDGNPDTERVINTFWPKVERSVNIEQVLYEKAYKVMTDG